MGTVVIDNERVIEASADRVWSILVDDFENVAAWASGITASGANPDARTVLDGAPSGGRVCDLPGFGVTDERIVEFDPGERVLAYTADADKLPGFASALRNRWQVVAQGPGRSLVTSSVSLQVSGVQGALAGPVLRGQLATTVRNVLEDLAVYAETDGLSERKRRELAKAGRA